MKIELTPLHTVLDEIEALHKRHYAEMVDADDYGLPDVDWELYRALSQTGSMACVTMRNDETLVGWAAFSLGTNPRYKHKLEAENQGIFIEEEYRGRWANAFINACKEYMRVIGAVETNFTVSDERIGRWLAAHGAKSNYRIWSFTHSH